MAHRGVVLLAISAALPTIVAACAEVVVDPGADSEAPVIYCNFDAGKVDGLGLGTGRCDPGEVCGHLPDTTFGFECCSPQPPPDSGLINDCYAQH